MKSTLCMKSTLPKSPNHESRQICVYLGSKSRFLQIDQGYTKKSAGHPQDIKQMPRAKRQAEKVKKNTSSEANFRG